MDHENLTTDFIEDEPLTIDVKIQGVRKSCGIPVDRVGVYSYATTATCLPDEEIVAQRGAGDPTIHDTI
jgi:hypothetical protein